MDYTTEDEKYMKEALKQAKKAYALGEVPIGCVIVYQDKIIGRGYNRRNTDKNTLAHAEITAINRASRKMGDWRLEDCILYVTLEPCQMCSGAIVQARIPRVVVGCMNPKAGCAGSVLNLLNMKEFNHQVELTTGILGEECSAMMKQFFKELRENKKRDYPHTRISLIASSEQGPFRLARPNGHPALHFPAPPPPQSQKAALRGPVCPFPGHPQGPRLGYATARQHCCQYVDCAAQPL